MKALRRRLNQPQYVLRPRAMLRRVLRSRDAYDPRAVATVSLPWGLEISVHCGEAVGYSIRTAGIFDIAVSEVIYRLVDHGDTAVDVGAHVGYMTGLMAARAGPAGNVVAVEPQPEVFGLLAQNVARWNRLPRVASIAASQLALAAQAGSGELVTGRGFRRNTGLASLAPTPSAAGASVDRHAVELATLEELVGDASVGLLKIDVEGAEVDVLEGGERILGERRVRDIVFEHTDGYPSRCTRFLEEFGMTIFSLDHALVGLRLAHASERPPRQGWEGPSYLATLEPARALARLRGRGWRVLRGRPLSGSN